MPIFKGGCRGLGISEECPFVSMKDVDGAERALAKHAALSQKPALECQ